jgi:radical SAM superfamily enzyme YgiQ (UPF0313 family)
MPDNGLANLAGALIQDGHSAHILDFATVGTIRRMTTPDLRQRLAREWQALRRPGQGPIAAARRLLSLPILQRAEAERRRLQQHAIEEIGSELADYVRKHNIDAVGFKLWNGDGLEGSVRCAAILRQQHPHLRIFGGGPHVDLFMERLLCRYPVFNALSFGEGEHTIVMLARQGANDNALDEIPNLIFRKPDGTIRLTNELMVENLDDLPMPVYDTAVYPAMGGDEKIKIMVIDESRGCRNSCNFCIHPVKSNKSVRLKSISRLLAEVRDMDRRYGFRAFRFAGSCTPYALLNDFARAVISEKLPVRYASFAHIREADEADFDTIRKSGCVSLFFGIESGSQTILDSLNKGITVENIGRTIARSKAAGIFTVGSLIFPCPGDTDQTEAETLELLQNNKPDALLFQAPIVAPRTAWFQSPEKYRIRIANPELYLNVAMTWKIKLQLPPRFWNSMPIEIDGRTYRKVLAKTSEFARKVAKMKIPTAITDETYLMSVQAGMDANRFRDTALGAFFSGDTETIESLTSAINHAEP